MRKKIDKRGHEIGEESLDEKNHGWAKMDQNWINIFFFVDIPQGKHLLFAERTEVIFYSFSCLLEVLNISE